jgi:hypothetical protein
MQTKTTFKFLGATLMSLMLTACGGGAGSALDNTIGGGNSSSSSSAISEDTLQSLEFIDAAPKVIYLKGTGGAESSLVRFRTMGKTGKPIQNIKVNFTLTSTIGGLALTQNSGVSDKDGYASTSINSGNVSTSIRVIATINDDAAITTQSSELIISTGLPDQKSMSIALEKFNPASWNYNGVTSEVSMLLADAYNNPAPDGTAVYFTTEGGSIQPSCTTLGGACKVVWTSQSPRPPRKSDDNSIERILCLNVAPDKMTACESERAGRSTILATTVGNESFKDTNGNGIYDLGIDIFRAAPTNLKCKANVPKSSFEATTEAEACDDLAEAYLDSNENGLREPTEHFVNFITSTKNDLGTDSYTPGNGIYNGSFCREKDELDGKCSRAPISIRKEHIIVMSCDYPLLDENGLLPAVFSGVYAVADCNGNAMPVGTTITVGTNPAITVGNQYDWTPISASGGTLVKIKVPSGKEFNITFPLINDTRRLGSGFGSEFINGGLEIGIGVSPLSPGGNTSITAYIVNTQGDPITSPMNVTFSSPCLSSGNASITGGNVIASVNGKVTANYIATGCKGIGGADEIKATTTFNNNLLTASNYVFIKADAAQTISFVDATPSLVSIKGAGGLETSRVRFRVLGQTGTPLKGECVTFALSTTAGGLALVPSNCTPAGPETFGSTTDADGYVTTIIQAGNVPTVVRVTATTANGVSTQSSALAVTTGIPDQNSTSLGLSDSTPVSWSSNQNGVRSTATIRLADAFNNPAPNGTAVTFTTSGGAIDGSCTTFDGECSVTWRSQNPRPSPAGIVSFSNITEDGFTMSCSDGSVDCRKGRVQILATAIGNESFIDGNGNGLYDDIDKDTFTNSNGVYNSTTKGLPISNTALCSPSVPHSSAAYGATNSCDDLREAYVDKNFNSIRDAIEEIVDFNSNGEFDLLPNGKYDGALCSGKAKADGDCTTNKVNVRESVTLVMACATPYNLKLVGLNPITLAAGAETLRLPILLADCNGNAMPAGTTIAISNTDLENATATTTFTTPLTNDSSVNPKVFLVLVKPDPVKTPKGTLTISVTSAGVTTPYSVKVN